jgi:hypothetical protein
MVIKKPRLLFFFTVSVTLLLLATGQQPASSHAIRAKQIETPASIWEVHTVDLNNDGKMEIILSGFDNRVYVKKVSGEDQWSYDVKGFPVAVAAGNVIGSAEKEILVASQDVDHTVYLLDYKGQLVRKRSVNEWLTAACVGDKDNDGKNEILLGDSSGILHILNGNLEIVQTKKLITGQITALALGDVRGDKTPELIVGRQEPGLLAFDHNLKRIWRAPKKVQGKRKTLPFHATRTVLIEDINSDGVKEIVVGSRPGAMISVYSGANGHVLWRYFLEHRWSYAQISIGNYVGDKNKEIVALRHAMLGRERRSLPQLIILDYTGKVILESDHRAIFYASDSADVDNDGYDEIILSSPRRGRYAYVVDIEKGSGNELRDVVSVPHDGIDDLIRQTKDRKPMSEPSRSHSKISILFEMKQSSALDIPLLEQYVQFLKNLSGNNIEFIIAPCSVGEEKTLRDNLKIHPFAARYVRTKSKINSEGDVRLFIKQFEDRKMPFMPLVGQQSWRLFSLERLEQFLRSSPQYCRGFYVYETNLDSDRWLGYLDYLVSVAQLCQKYGKKLVLAMHKDFWRRVIAREDFCQKMLRPEFKDVLVPMFKSTGMRSPALNIGAILGLWKTDLVDEWGVSIQEDGYLINTWFVVAPNDVILRGDIMGAALGATWFRIELSSEFLESIKTTSGHDIRYALNTHRHRGLFHDLTRKNIIRLPENSDQVILSPVALQPLPSKPITGVLDYRENMQSVHPDHVFHYIYDLDRYSESFFPKTPIGYVPLLPYFLDTKRAGSFKRVVRTDGRLSGKGIQEDFNKYASDLPFRAKDVCLLVNRFKDEYRVYLISPGLMDIRTIQTELEIQLPGSRFTATDVITNKELAVVQKKIKLTVPDGTFRLISITDNQ